MYLWRSVVHLVFRVSSCEKKALNLKKHSGLNGIRTHDLRCRCSAPPTELSSQLGAGHIVSS